MPGITKTHEEHKVFIALNHFTGAEVSGFFFPLGFLGSLLKSPTGCGGRQTSQKPARAAQGPRADPEAARQLSLPQWEPAGFLQSRQRPCRAQALTFLPTEAG